MQGEIILFYFLLYGSWYSLKPIVLHHAQFYKIFRVSGISKPIKNIIATTRGQESGQTNNICWYAANAIRI